MHPDEISSETQTDGRSFSMVSDPDLEFNSLRHHNFLPPQLVLLG